MTFDAYPGVNAVTLMELKEAPDARQAALLPVVAFAVERRIAAGQPDYWDYATRLELAVLAHDQAGAETALADALAHVREAWEPETTRASALGMHSRKSGLDCVKIRRNSMDFVALKACKLKSARKSHFSLPSAIGFMPGIAQTLSDFNYFSPHAIRVRKPCLNTAPVAETAFCARVLPVNTL